MKQTLKDRKVVLARYDDVSRFLKGLDVGPLTTKQHGPAVFSPPFDCLCASSNLVDSLKRIFMTQSLFDLLTFPSLAQQKDLFDALQFANPELFQGLNASHRTVFIRQTGDNFRSFRLPTEQMSFCLLNMAQHTGSPNSQIVNCIWRGSEDRQYIQAHCHGLYQELAMITKNGIDLLCPGQTLPEHFNVVVLYVADLSHMQYVLGRVSVTAKYGCFRCKKELNGCDKQTSPPAERLSVVEMVELGKEAERTLGPNPREDKEYTSFHQTHFGQVQPPLFSALVQETMPPCGLHLVLAIHRIFWKVIHSVTKARSQEELVVPALRRIGCNYLAFQLKSYLQSKGKYYDGSSTMRMTGNDCKRLEAGATTFLSTFLVSRRAETFASPSADKLKHIHDLLQDFADIATDLRATTTTEARVESFGRRVEAFFKDVRRFFPNECSSKHHYMHVLRDHIWPLMKFWHRHLNWGYGMFSTAAGEHLNKRLKVYEADHTSSTQGTARFERILHMFRVGLLHYPKSTLRESAAKVTCSACGEKGHTRKNKLCPNHIAPGPIVFADSGDEAE